MRRILERGGRKFRKFENYKDQNENFSTQNQFGSSVQNPMKSKKKSSSLKYSPVFAQNWVKAKNKGLRLPFVCSNLLPELQKGGGPCRNFAYYSMLIILTWRPKGGGHGPMPPLNTPLNEVIYKHVSCNSLGYIM